MVSQFSPSLVYLTEDEEENNEPERNISHGNSYTSTMNNNLPRRKRRLPDMDVRLNSSVVNWSKRQRNDYYPNQHSTHNSIHCPEPEKITYPSDVYDFTDQESHSFHAFDWTAEPQTRPRIHSNPIPYMAIVPPLPHVMNGVKHHLDQSEAVPISQMSRQRGRYVQQSSRKSVTMPISTTPPPSTLPLPLPTPTLSLIRPQAQRVHLENNLRIPYLHSTPPPPPQSAHHPAKSVFPSPATYYPPTHAPISTSAILCQALNGTGVLSAFYDSKCYRCNICKFITVTSSKLLQHLFTHIFFCHQCPFYSYSQHTLYQHIFDEHQSNVPNDNIDPKSLELLYITRCADGTFALCMDSSATSTITPTTTEKLPPPAETTKKVKRRPRPKKCVNKEPVVLPEKSAAVLQPSSSSTVAKRPISKEKPSSTYVLMKHRRCYSSRMLPSLHSLTLEYKICQENTIRHMCHTYGRFNRRKFLPKSGRHNLIDQVTICLKAVVNQVVNTEESRDSSDPLCLLSGRTLNLILKDADLRTMTNLLKLNNKYDRSIEQNTQNRLESTLRLSNQHVFILSSTEIGKNEQPTFPTLHTSITSANSTFTETKLNKLPISYDNTNRFLKGNLNHPPKLAGKPSTTNKPNPQPKNPESAAATVLKSPRYRHSVSTSTKLVTNNNSVISSKPRISSSSTVIVID